MWIIIEERKKREFESFEELRERGKVPDPVTAIVERILREIRGEERYYLFLDPPPHVVGAVKLGYLEKIFRSIGIE